ncbi:MAG TPA: hypothetical protein VH062_23545 [Polyangiaceae bacterium]|jgi:hypothetical protein|nr:hypothetical protein [Polyangiaceae bacterium]
MRRFATIFSLSLALAASGAGVACTANIHDNTLNVDAKVDINTSVDVDSITAGESVPLTLSAEGVTLVEPKATPPTGHENDAAYFKVYLDDTTTTELTATASTSVTVKIPEGTKEGKHKLICGLANHDTGEITKTTKELDITVKASASVSSTTTTTTMTKTDGG